MDYPTEHNKQPIQSDFLTASFTCDGVRTFYGIDKKTDARNNWTMEQFKQIQAGNRTFPMVNKDGKEYHFVCKTVKEGSCIALFEKRNPP